MINKQYRCKAPECNNPGELFSLEWEDWICRKHWIRFKWNDYWGNK